MEFGLGDEIGLPALQSLNYGSWGGKEARALDLAGGSWRKRYGRLGFI
jgi:hypothetical protein